MRKKSIWTSEKINFIKENYATKGAKYCAEHLQCSLGSVHSKAHREGIKSRKNQLKTHKEYETELMTKEIEYVPLERYVDSHTPILHECFNGHISKVKPYSVLSGKGCAKCEVLRKTKSHEQYLIDVGNHNKNITVLDTYKNNITPIRHRCAEGHIWWTRPATFLSSKIGCPDCSRKGFKPNKPAILYYIKITKYNLTYYKIGITNNSVEERFRIEPPTTQIRVIKETPYPNGSDARAEEQRILKQFSEHRQNVPELLVSGGTTELFEFDILGIDN